MAQETVVSATVERDGVLIDRETGEIIGIRDPFGDWGFLPDDEPTRFTVNSMATLEWVMERFQNRELAAQTLTRRRELLVKNLDAMIADENRDLERLHARFDAEVESFSRDELEKAGWKRKSLRTAYGTVSFRISRASHKIVDMVTAVDWAKRMGFGSVIRVQESVAVSDLVPLLPEQIDGLGWLQIQPSEERFHISVGE